MYDPSAYIVDFTGSRALHLFYLNFFASANFIISPNKIKQTINRNSLESYKQMYFFSTESRPFFANDLLQNKYFCKFTEYESFDLVY